MDGIDDESVLADEALGEGCWGFLEFLGSCGAEGLPGDRAAEEVERKRRLHGLILRHRGIHLLRPLADSSGEVVGL